MEFISMVGVLGFIREIWLLYTSKFHDFFITILAALNTDSGKGRHKNIEKVKEYRNASMTFMTNDKKAELYKETAWIDGLDNMFGKNVEKTKDYINSDLTFKTNDEALKSIRRK